MYLRIGSLFPLDGNQKGVAVVGKGNNITVTVYHSSGKELSNRSFSPKRCGIFVVTLELTRLILCECGFECNFDLD